MMPRLFYDRMDEFGADFAIVYPTAGLRLPRISDDEMKPLMKEVVNKVFTVLMHWNDEEFMSALVHWGERQTVQ